MKAPHELWSDPVEAEALKARLGDLHRAKILLADEVLVVGAYIGDSTRAEIAYARSLGKPVRFTPRIGSDLPDLTYCSQQTDQHMSVPLFCTVGRDLRPGLSGTAHPHPARTLAAYRR